MKNNLFTAIIVAAISLSACQSNTNQDAATTATTTDIHKVIVEEVLQTTQYTYLHVKEGDTEKWLAVQKIEAAVGETLYHKADWTLMTDFESKELNKIFKEVLLLDKISASPDFSDTKTTAAAESASQMAPEADDQVASQPAAKSVSNALVEEVLQTSKYTYLHVKTGDGEKWLAVSKMEAKKGESYSYEGGLVMTDFASKELNRTFKEVLFLESVIKDQPENHAASTDKSIGAKTMQGSKVNPNTAVEKQDVKLNHGKGEITIAELFKNKQSYSGKTIKIKGKVTKFTPAIMHKNWIHLQDGTDNAGKFDLTITTDVEVKVGDTITLEGKISLDKDFGYGYLYEVMMEDGKLLK